MVGADLTYGQLKNAPGVRCKCGRNRSDNVESMSDEERYEPPAADPAAEGVPTPQADPATNRPTLGIKEAAKACGVHEDTIRRANRKGLFPNATKGAGGAVMIPVTDLLAAGYRLHAPQAVAEATKVIEDTESQAGQALAEMAELKAENRRLVADLARIEAQVAELKAEKAQLLDLMGLQLKALNAGATPERPQSRPFWRRVRE